MADDYLSDPLNKTSIQQVDEELAKQEELYGDGDPDGDTDPMDIDKNIEDVTGNEPALDSPAGFVTRQIDSDEKDLSKIPPDGSGVNQEE